MGTIEKRLFGCLVCDQGRLDPLWDILLRCPACGFVTARMDSHVDVRRLYEGDYFKGAEYLDYRGDEMVLRKNFGRRLAEILKRKSSGRLLEVGAAYGFFLDMARAHFSVVGFEVNPEAAYYGRKRFGVDIRTSEFLEAAVEDVKGPVDVAVMWDVIEHLERPDLYLDHIARLSRRGSLLFLTTGDIGSRLARWRGCRWRMIHPPSHLHYFDRQTIARMLKASGYTVVDIKSVGFSRSFLQMAYSVLVLRLGMARAYRALAKLIPSKWSLTVNLGDIMQVTAERT